MKIAICSSIDGTGVYDELGEELFNSDRAADIALFCEGLKKEFPEAEFVFDSNPARGATFEAGRRAGENLKNRNERYQAVASLNGMTGAKAPQSTFEAALKEFETSDKKIDNYVIIDRKEKIAELMKGSIDALIESLNIFMPGWKAGKIKRE